MNESLFSDLLVIDCASFIAGPVAATIMADFGARVIKVEPPGAGDGYRLLEKLPAMPKSDTNYPWRITSRSKESIALDLKSDQGREILYRLVDRADVFITNFPLPVREALAVRADDIRARNPKIIYASMTAYGETGAQAHMSGYDATAWWARSGLMDLVRANSGVEPAISMPGMGDHMAANMLYGAILTGLYRRQRTGEGSEVGSSLMGNGLWSNGLFVQGALDGANVSRSFNTGKKDAFACTLRCRDDRWFILAVLPQVQDKAWPAIADALGHPEWVDDPRFVDTAARKENNNDLFGLIEETIAQQDWAHWQQAFAERGITCGAVSKVEDIVTDQQAEDAGMISRFAGTDQRTIDSPVFVSGVKKVEPRLPPGVGEHSRAILLDLGYSAEDADSLIAAGAVAT